MIVSASITCLDNTAAKYNLAYNSKKVSNDRSVQPWFTCHGHTQLYGVAARDLQSDGKRQGREEESGAGTEDETVRLERSGTVGGRTGRGSGR